jgi:hypothetical protein
MSRSPSPTKHSMEDENPDNQSIHGEDNQTFSADDVKPDITQLDTPSNDIDNLRVIFRKDISTVDFNQRQDSTQPLDINENEQSPYEQVAANVSNKDDPTIAVLTFRSWFLGLIFTGILSFVNQFFWYRTSPLVIGVLVAQLLSHLVGKFLAKILPTRKFKIFRWNFTFNPGPFTIKEHCIITTMASTASVSY